MSVVTHGADIDALRAWAHASREEASRLATTTARLDAVVRDMPWSGPDRQRFAEDWGSRFSPGLRAVADALETAATRVTRDADEQEWASTDGGTRPLGGGTGPAAVDDATREARESGWARGAAQTILGALGRVVAGPLGGLVGAVAGPALIDHLVGVADAQADRTSITEVTADAPVHDTIPTGPGDLVRDMADMYDRPGEVRLDMITTPTGRQVAVLYAPGTESWSLDRDDPSPMGFPGAIASASGTDSPLRRLMLGALAEVPEGTPIIIASHSQSSFQSLDLAADPYVKARHQISAVITTGAGGGQFDIPSGTTVISARNSGDLVAAIGGAPDRAIDITGSWGSPLSAGQAHSVDRYADLVAGSTDPQLQAWWRSTGIVPGSTMTSRVFRGHVQPGD